MKFRETDAFGSFLAWGTGFYYEYDATSKTLEVTHAGTKKPIFFTELHDHRSRAPAWFVRTLEKATQVNALILSNNTTIDLAQTVEEQRLPPMVKTCMRMAEYAYNLEYNENEAFSARFCEHFSLKTLKIEKIRGFASSSWVYVGTLTTHSGNRISADGLTIHGLIRDLSQKIITELLPREFGYDLNRPAHRYLLAASKLASLGYLMDEHFEPVHKMVKTEAFVQDTAID